MQKEELESFGKSFLLPNGSCEISVAGKNSKRKDTGRCLWEALGFGAPALGTRVLGSWWEMHPYKMWTRGREGPKNRRTGCPAHSFCCCVKNVWAVGVGASGQDENKLKVLEKLGCQTLETAELGVLLKPSSAVHTAILFW